MPSLRQEMRVLADSLLLACFKWTRCYFGDEKRHSFDTSSAGRREKTANRNMDLFLIRNGGQVSWWDVLNPLLCHACWQIRRRGKEKGRRGSADRFVGQNPTHKDSSQVWDLGIWLLSQIPEAGCFSIKEMGPSALSWPRYQGAFLWGQPCRYSHNVVPWPDTGEKFLFNVQIQ